MDLDAVYQGDCLELMKQLPDNYVDSVITDPPYGLRFMGKAWDYDVPKVVAFAEMLRVAKPGATLLCFGGTRTWHRIAVNIEDAGWQIRDTLCWLYGSGFPKSLDISKAIDKAAGAEREQVGWLNHPAASIYSQGQDKMSKEVPATVPATLWDGWGSALKPAFEPIIMAMKPLEGGFAGNALKWGVAGLNIKECRIPFKDAQDAQDAQDLGNSFKNKSFDTGVYQMNVGNSFVRQEYDNSKGRFPANVIHDGSEEVMALFPDTKGNASPRTNSGKGNTCYGEYETTITQNDAWGDSGSAARFFYCAKASRSERDELLEGQEAVKVDESRQEGDPGGNNPRNRGVNKQKNFHPTVKPLSLMEYLCKLTKTPGGGIVLDPYAGSGSTGVACQNTGRHFLLFEINKEYCEIAKKRLSQARLGTFIGAYKTAGLLNSELV